MATIRSQMVLNDGMSAILKKITHVLDFTIHSFEDMKRASGEAFDPAIFQATYAEIGQINEQMDKMERYYIKAAQNQDYFNKGLLTGTSHATGLTNQIGKLAAAAGAAFGVKQLFNLSDQMTSNTARLSLIVDDGGSVDALEAKITASAQRSRAAYLDTANAIASMGANAGAAFSGNDELIAFMEQVNKQFVIGGASAQGQSAAMLQLTQAMAAGALRGEELNSILENAPGIARAIESYMGIAEGSIKQYAQEGAITAEVVKNALFAAADETNAKFESMPMTWGQIWTSMQNRALTALDPILTKLNGIANSEQFSTVADSALQAFSVIASVATVALDAVFGLGAAIVDNWSWIEPIVWGVVTVMGIYQGIVLALAIAEGIKTAATTAAAFSENAHAAALAMSTGATFSATVAQYGLNAALYACPITWIVIAVIALIAVFYALFFGPSAEEGEGLGRKEQQGGQVGQGHEGVAQVHQLPDGVRAPHRPQYDTAQKCRPIEENAILSGKNRESLLSAPFLFKRKEQEALLPVVAPPQDGGEGEQQQGHRHGVLPEGAQD